MYETDHNFVFKQVHVSHGDTEGVNGYYRREHIDNWGHV